MVHADKAILREGIEHGRDLLYELSIVRDSQDAAWELRKQFSHGGAGEGAEIPRGLV